MTKKIKQIAIYGKGGIGKSTTTSNISAALSKQGYKVMQFGCDPKADSTNTLRGGTYIPTVLDTMREKTQVKPEDVIFKGFNGIYCVEAGGPAPGVGCAGRGIITAVQLLKQLKVYEELDLDVIIYDVLGDVVCGGFAVPIREGIAEHVFTVSSADFMAIYAANNLFKGINSACNHAFNLRPGGNRHCQRVGMEAAAYIIIAIKHRWKLLGGLRISRKNNLQPFFFKKALSHPNRKGRFPVFVAPVKTVISCLWPN
jgi:nitrogenase iron protein